MTSCENQQYTQRERECFHMSSRRPYWCHKTMERRPCWCPKRIFWELYSFLMQMLSFVLINLHRCWPREGKQSIFISLVPSCPGRLHRANITIGPGPPYPLPLQTPTAAPSVHKKPRWSPGTAALDHDYLTGK